MTNIFHMLPSCKPIKKEKAVEKFTSVTSTKQFCCFVFSARFVERLGLLRHLSSSTQNLGGEKGRKDGWDGCVRRLSVDIDIHVENRPFFVLWYDDWLNMMIYNLPESRKNKCIPPDSKKERIPIFGNSHPWILRWFSTPKEVIKHVRVEGIFCLKFSRLPFGKPRWHWTSLIFRW